ncbi:PQQ-binding-like beta-propeller repeat protein [Dactylosporangium sp. NPDC051484]|uniref:outer membrane protein assembly factor BamB family protein n=1 Tax=Dactylosporangium sp. NPDC051484 TaxID=3154942 RepID=UPI0034509C28
MTGVATGPVIDLGVVERWAPPEPPRPQRPGRAGRPGRGGWAGRRRGSALLAAAVLAVLLPAADAPPGGPVFTLPGRMFDVHVTGDRLYVTRAVEDGALRVEARTPGGRLLWGAPLEPNQAFSFATADVVVLTNRYPQGAFAPSRVVVRDARTGAELWRRDAAEDRGAAGGRIILKDLAGEVGGAGGAGGGESPPETTLVAVDERTGAAAWTVTAPAGARVELHGLDGDEARLESLTQLGPDGVLRTHDLATGAVVRRERLERSGPVFAYTTGAAQVVVATAGRQAIVGAYERGTGRLLWQGDVAFYTPLFACAPERWCRVDGEGMRAYDAGTGEQVWRVAEYNSVFGLVGDIVVLGGFGTSAAPSHEPVVLAVDARTGAVRHRLDGWYAGSGRTVLMTLPDLGRRDALVGVYDPGSGRVAVLGRVATGLGTRCAAGAGVVACTAGGTLTVWRWP